jgi:hypothetical protein
MPSTTQHVNSRRALAACVLAALSLTGAAGRQLLKAEEQGISSTLRGIASGQVVYSVVCAPGFYAPSLEVLARPAKGEKTAFILDSDVPKPGAKFLEQYGYRVEMSAPASPQSPASCNGVPKGGSAQGFVVTARPLPGLGGRSFRIDEKGELTPLK